MHKRAYVVKVDSLIAALDPIAMDECQQHLRMDRRRDALRILQSKLPYAFPKPADIFSAGKERIGDLDGDTVYVSFPERELYHRTATDAHTVLAECIGEPFIKEAQWAERTKKAEDGKIN